ncbi:MAG: hypothetical protein Q8S94_00165 [Pseudohongiella sp.]|nr:hypothetical protein [Pseudohongiella sp.]
MVGNVKFRNKHNKNRKCPGYWGKSKKQSALSKFQQHLKRAVSFADSDGEQAKQRASDSMQEVVNSYQKGIGAEPDSRKAFEWLKLAAEQHNLSWAYFDLAMAYKEGVGTAQNVELFLEWIKRAAGAEDNPTEAMFQLAEYHLDISPEEAYNWKFRMAELGGAGAQLELAKVFYSGKGVVQDTKKSLEYAELAIKSAKEAKAKTANEDYSIEDYPLSLFYKAVLSKLTLGQFLLLELKEASQAASEAIEDAKKKQRQVSDELLLIVVRYVDELKMQQGEEDQGWQEILAWLSNEILQKFHGSEASRSEFSRIVYEFSKVQNSVDQEQLKKRLEDAANLGSRDAQHDLAVDAAMGEKLELFRKSMDQGSMPSYIYFNLIGLTGDNKFKQIVDSFLELYKIVDDIKSDHKVTSESNEIEFVAHYTKSVETIRSMLPDNKSGMSNVLRLNHIAYFNDPDEGQRLIRFRPSHGKVNYLESFFNENADEGPNQWKDYDFSVHIGSFSEDKDRLDLWRAYGNDGSGFCIVTPVSVFDGAHEAPIMSGGWKKRDSVEVNSDPVRPVLYRVKYDDESVKTVMEKILPILERINAFMTDKGISVKSQDTMKRLVRDIMSELLYLYKGDEYRTEKELRVVAARTPSNPGIKRKDFKFGSRVFIETTPVFFEEAGSKIVIGPKVKDRVAIKIELEHRLAVLRLGQTCKVEYSNTRYR